MRLRTFKPEQLNALANSRMLTAVRNHTSNLFDKLGVRSRSQAIGFARDYRFKR
jgi:DNA-binding NarL/FixJ family response regulator